ncbi:probable protein phosphatase 2C 79 [Raphanus sativus]|uniref:Probable protein phosphatase 2C 79 n=1 Tax=Raphanus sativus TaxID=3726 RepID=A0A6J0N3N9_RAPSA|nr:probable protein phosphatase 2C 79 [Raphanus sativus]
MKLLSPCVWPSSSSSSDSSTVGKQDGLLWYKDSGHHLLGEFSMAVVQANNLLEDQSQVESGPLSTLDSSGSYGTFMSNQEAVDIVHNHPRNGIARRLVKTALQAAAKKREMRYSDLKKIERGVRRHFHDDITVVVIFLDANVTLSLLGIRMYNFNVKATHY